MSPNVGELGSVAALEPSALHVVISQRCTTLAAVAKRASRAGGALRGPAAGQALVDRASVQRSRRADPAA